MTVKAGQKCTAIRRAHRARAAWPTRSTEAIARAAGEDHRRRPGARGRAHGRAGQPRPARGGPQGGPGAARLAPSSSTATPTASTVVDADAERGAFIVAGAAARRAPARVEPHDVEAFGPVSTVMAYDDLDEAVALAARGKGSLVGSLVTHDPAVARDGRPRRGAVARPHPGARPRRRRRVHRPRLAAAEARPRRPRSRRRRRGAGRHARRPAPHAAHRDPGLARHADGDHRPLDHGLAAHREPARTRSARAWPSCGSATRSPRSRAQVRLDDIDHFAEFTGDTFYAHTDEEAAAKNPLLPRASSRPPP